MLLSVVVYNHKLTLGQWAGAGIVFAGISVEAWVKRKGLFLSLFDATELILTLPVLNRRARQTHRPRERKGETEVPLIVPYPLILPIILLSSGVQHIQTLRYN